MEWHQDHFHCDIQELISVSYQWYAGQPAVLLSNLNLTWEFSDGVATFIMNLIRLFVTYILESQSMLIFSVALVWPATTKQDYQIVSQNSNLLPVTTKTKENRATNLANCYTVRIISWCSMSLVNYQTNQVFCQTCSWNLLRVRKLLME